MPARRRSEPDRTAPPTLHAERRPRALLGALDRMEEVLDGLLPALPRLVPPAPDALRPRTTTVAGTRLFYRARAVDPADPPGTPVLVHLHGFGVSGRVLLPVAGLLAAEFPCYVPDLPGHGRSASPPEVLGINRLADSVAEYLDAVGLGRVTLVGSSMGAAVAAAFATRHAHRLDRLVLVSPAGGPYNRPLARGVGQLLLDATREPVGMLAVAIPDYLRFGLLDTLRMFRAMAHYPVIARLVELGVPVLGVIGTRDPLMPPPAVIHELVDLMAAPVTLVGLRGVAHAANFSHPALLAHVIRAYLRGEPIVSPPGVPRSVTLLRRPGAPSSAG